jgi:imidazolonepropionase-like amidohydrolase
MTHYKRTPYLLIGAAVFLACHAQVALAETVVLKAAHLFDSVSGKLTEHGVIVVSDGKILAVGSDSKIPDKARVIDLGDATLLPGLIDAHVHMSAQSSDNWYRDQYEDLKRFPAEKALYGAHYAKLTLEAGITTVRDVGSSEFISLGLRNAIAAGVIPGPRMLISNHAIGATGGHRRIRSHHRDRCWEPATAPMNAARLCVTRSNMAPM